ncbi:MAG: methyltransferase domain-containing protein [Hyphomicrobiaceae bacterium]
MSEADTVAIAGPTPAMADPYDRASSLPYRFRARRFAEVRRLIAHVLAENGRCRILDIGGTERYWDIAGDFIAGKDISIDVLNLQAAPTTNRTFRALAGDAADLAELPSDSYDLVHSNSVIEHVGTWDRMMRMAENVRRLAPRYYLQTPNFWFPLEPHFRAPFFHWLPEQLRYRIFMHRSLGFRGKAPSIDAAMRSIQGACLLDRGQMQALFPDAEIKRERVLGLTKSWMAVRG